MSTNLSNHGCTRMHTDKTGNSELGSQSAKSDGGNSRNSSKSGLNPCSSVSIRGFSSLKPTKQRAVALVVTLLMLSVITVVVVAFLALSRRERGSISQTINLTDSKMMNDMALERANGQVIAPILATTNMLAVELMVSRNYIYTNGFQPGVSSPFNVSYVYGNGQSLSTADFLQNLTNLLFDPRPPVFVRTNRAGFPPASDFRFWVDLN